MTDERKLVTIRTISEIEAIPDADRIVLAKIDGWQLVTQKDNNFQPGDKVVYFEIDSFIPTDNETFSFLNFKTITYNGVAGHRLRTIRLKKRISQGLILPLSHFVPDSCSVQFPEVLCDQIVEKFGITKWEAVMNAQLAGTAKGNFPSFLRKTDQERLQNMFNHVKYRQPPGEIYEETIKEDGSSMTVYYRDGDFGVCSRNLDLKEWKDVPVTEETPEGENHRGAAQRNAFWATAEKYGLKDKLTEFGFNVALQGELVGPGIQGNRLGLKEVEFHVFDVFLIDLYEYADSSYRQALCEQLGVPHVPVIRTGTFDFQTIDEALAYADHPEQGKYREGVVFKSVSEPGFSFKIISNKYLLKYED
jgi:RNA ligase (TIGR02306 family)